MILIVGIIFDLIFKMILTFVITRLGEVHPDFHFGRLYCIHHRQIQNVRATFYVMIKMIPTFGLMQSGAVHPKLHLTQPSSMANI
jgi:hypothetical protein